MKDRNNNKNHKELKFSWSSPNFQFEIDSSKEIKIKVNDKINFASSEDFHTKLTNDVGNFLDKLRKFIHGQE